MNLNKSLEFFAPSDCKEKIHIVGCGSVGSTIAENLVRFGLTNLVLWDFDIVEDKNVVNQMYRSIDVGKPKVEALRDFLVEINPEVSAGLKLKPEGWHGEPMSGWIFLAVDSIDVRRQIVEMHKGNPFVKAVFDFRTRLTDAQFYAADWEDRIAVKSMINSMDFTEEQADESTPVSACGVVLGVAPTVRMIVALGVSNFINMVKGEPYKKFINADVFSGMLNAI